MKQYRFPEGFVWGSATSAYQVEGSPLADGSGPSIQDGWAHTPGNVRDGSTADVAADTYNRYREDAATMREMGLQHYQFSMNWARILPEGVGKPNQKALDYYDSFVDSLLEAGVSPTPILYVWELPAALQYRGGWTNRDVADWFAEFAAVAFDLVGDRASHWATVCEPWSIAHLGHTVGELAPGMNDLHAGMRAVHHVNLAHGRAVQAFRASSAKGQIGCHCTTADSQPASASEADATAAARVMDYFTGLYIDPIMKGAYPSEMERLLADAWPPVAEGDMATISTPIDFIGVTYYSGFVVAEGATTDDGSRPNALFQLLDVRLLPTDFPKTSMGWGINPKGIGRVLRWMRDRYGNFPVYVSENGAAFDDVVEDGRVADPERIAYIRDHLIEAHGAIQDGVDLRGWFVWSQLDTWEYMSGFKGRFGLVHVDYETQRRTVKDSGWWYRDVMAANGFELET
jgi:beta-glucosidase